MKFLFLLVSSVISASPKDALSPTETVDRVASSPGAYNATIPTRALTPIPENPSAISVSAKKIGKSFVGATVGRSLSQASTDHSSQEMSSVDSVRWLQDQTISTHHTLRLESSSFRTERRKQYSSATLCSAGACDVLCGCSSCPVRIVDDDYPANIAEATAPAYLSGKVFGISSVSAGSIGGGLSSFAFL